MVDNLFTLTSDYVYNQVFTQVYLSLKIIGLRSTTETVTVKTPILHPVTATCPFSYRPVTLYYLFQLSVSNLTKVVVIMTEFGWCLDGKLI